MGYWIYLFDDDGKPVQIERHQEGGTFVVGGTNDASMSLTFNYCGFYYEHLDPEIGIKWIHGQKAKDTIQRLQKAVDRLGDNPSDNYWDSTQGNAGHALAVLLSWATQHPEATWEVS